MEIEYDPAKREATLLHRGLDMARVGEVFEGAYFTLTDDRADYGEIRFVTAGWLDGRLVVLTWTQRGDAIRAISLRKANGREKRKYGPRVGGPG